VIFYFIQNPPGILLSRTAGRLGFRRVKSERRAEFDNNGRKLESTTAHMYTISPRHIYIYIYILCTLNTGRPILSSENLMMIFGENIENDNPILIFNTLLHDVLYQFDQLSIRFPRCLNFEGRLR